MRIRGTRFVLALMLVGVAGVLGSFAPATTAAASCVGPVIGIGTEVPAPGFSPAPVPVQRGSTLVVNGSYFRDGCADTIGISGGCQPRAIHQEQETPQQNVPLVLSAGTHENVLDTSSAAGPDFSISWQITIPADAVLGRSSLRASTAELPITVVR